MPGLSPRVRGNRLRRSENACDHGGSIPACAGQPRTPADHYAHESEGLSPRVRGNPHCYGSDTVIGCYRVYPRVCGATIRHARAVSLIAGTLVYPRVCGATTLRAAVRVAQRAGSIPACAGQPRMLLQGPGSPLMGLSPRVRGNHYPATRNLPANPAGLSPRVRGNLMWTSSNLYASRTGVYPRVCGATILGSSPLVISVGLSPRVRATPAREIFPYYELGLSPRVRGNLPSTTPR